LQQSLDNQRENQIRLEESETELRAILQNAHDAFIAIDEDGMVLEWNRQAEQLLGWFHKEAVGKELAELIIPFEQRELHRRGMTHFLNTGEGVVINNRIEINALRRDGNELPVEMTVGYVRRRAGHLFIAFLHDITERQAFRNSLQAICHLSAIASNAADRVKEFDVRTTSTETPVGTLSGGNQQKVILARELGREHKVLVASQPTRGLDVGSIEFVHKRIVAARDSGVAVLIVSSELDEIYALADRIGVMYEGRITGFRPPTVPVEELGLLMAGATDSPDEGPPAGTSPPADQAGAEQAGAEQ